MERKVNADAAVAPFEAGEQPATDSEASGHLCLREIARDAGGPHDGAEAGRIGHR
jgi:hypothetical protein